MCTPSAQTSALSLIKSGSTSTTAWSKVFSTINNQPSISTLQRQVNRLITGVGRAAPQRSSKSWLAQYAKQQVNQAQSMYGALGDRKNAAAGDPQFGGGNIGTATLIGAA